MTTLGSALEAFIREHEYCGELDTGLEDDRRMGDVYVRGEVNLSFDMAHTGGSLGSDVQG